MGQLDSVKQQKLVKQLHGYVASAQRGIEITAALTDENGNPEPLANQTIQAFDQILSTFKFTK